MMQDEPFDLVRVIRWARRLMAHPAVAYQEQGVAGEVGRICAEEGLPLSADPYGNLCLRLNRPAPGVRPMVMVAHMDHPGFEILRKLGPGRWRARFLGGVPRAYFCRGTALRLYPGNGQGRLGRPMGKGGDYEVTGPRGVGWKPSMAVWDVPPVRVRAGRLEGRACDDLVGVAVLLAVMASLKRRRSRAPVWGWVTRAEEVGFQGALTVAAGRQLPRSSLLVSLETSKEIAPVRLGGGVVLRGGDRTSLFDSEATRYMSAIAEMELAAGKGLDVQRAWMTGGTCEATAFQAFGYRSAALCVPLGNYHNAGSRNRIRAEHVNLHDVACMARLLEAMALRWRSYDRLTRRVPTRLKALLRQGRDRLGKG